MSINFQEKFQAETEEVSTDEDKKKELVKA